LNEAPISPPRFRFTTLFWVGLGLFVVGTGPLLAVILLSALGLTKDPNPNPIGFGLLAFLTFYPSVGKIERDRPIKIERKIERDRPIACAGRRSEKPEGVVLRKIGGAGQAALRNGLPKSCVTIIVPQSRARNRV
jgi:hypothetical protein